MPTRGLHLFKAQQKHKTLCYTSGYYCHEQGSNSKYSCQIPLFFPAGTPNWKHNFFSALTQHSQRQTQQSVMPTSYSRSSPSSKAKILLYLMGGGRLGSQRIHSSASLLSTFLSQDIHSYSQHPISSSLIPILSSSV